MAQYYIGKNNQQTGPFEVNQLLANGLTPDTLVWCSGMQGWDKAKNVAELAGLFVAKQPQYQQPVYGYQQPAYGYQQPVGGGGRQRVDMFLMSNGENLPSEKLPYIKERLMMRDDNAISSLSMLSFKSPLASLIMSLLLGSLGVDRFYIGDIGMGIGKLLTLGGCGIWTIIDWFLIMGATRQKNYEMLAPYL